MSERNGLQHHRILAGILSAALVLSAGLVGNLATFANITTWYAHLNKPGFTPPNWVFGPAWSLLYVLMIIAFWRILILAKPVPGRRAAIIAFCLQLALNAAWSVVFFGQHSPFGGLIVIGLMIGAIIATIILFGRIDTPASLLLWPYLAWVCFATALNAGIWLLN